MARPKNRGALQRRKPRREPFNRVLIVSEGSKTEPYYLRELIADCQLTSASVEIFGDGGSAPTSVVEYAISLFQRDPDFNAVFCVFDRDAHDSFDEALRRISRTKLVRRSGRYKVGEADFEAITSIPCFEYWVLLHYRYTTAPMPRFVDVERLLKAIPQHAGYAKGAKGLFVATRHLLDTALEHAKRANAAAEAANTDNPTTRMPVLIRYLLDLAEKKK